MAAPRKETAPLLAEVGVTGLKNYGGIINEEFLNELRGVRGVKVLREMRDNDPVIGATIFAIEMLLRHVTWRVEAASDKAEDREAAQFVSSCLEDMEHSWSDFVAEVLSMLSFGWSYFEVVYKKRTGETDDPLTMSKNNDNKIGWRKFSIRSQDTLSRWVFSDNGDLLGMEQVAPPRFIPTVIPLNRAVHFRTTRHKNNPEGRSCYRNAYRPWYFKKRIEEIEAIGIERDLAGLPVLTVPGEILVPTATPQQKTVAEQYRALVTRIRRDEQEGIVLPGTRDANGNKLYELTLLSTGSRRQFDLTSVLQRKSQEIAMVVLGDFILLGHEKVGSFALSSDKTDLFAVALGAWLKMMKDELNRDPVPRLLRVNGLRGKCYLDHDDIEKPNLVEMVDAISKLAGVGMPLFPDNALESYVRSVAGWPEPTTEPVRDVDQGAGKKKAVLGEEDDDTKAQAAQRDEADGADGKKTVKPNGAAPDERAGA